MKNLKVRWVKGCVLFLLGTSVVFAQNQTPTTSTILPETSLPFSVVIQQANFQLPVGIHSGMVGVYQGLWVFIAGKTDGLHGFGPDPFPVLAQNTSIYVVNPTNGAVYSRSLKDPGSGLTQAQIDSLSVVSPQGYQEENTLYMTGGYGIDTATATYTTKPFLTAIYLPGIVQWVMRKTNARASQYIQQLYNPEFQVTGGEMLKLGNVSQLVFGQDFEGVYTSSSNGNYIEQVRQFQIGSIGGKLSANIFSSKPLSQDPNYRRRDMNVLPAILNTNGKFQYGMVGYGGVFTVSSGVWTVPVVMDQAGNPSMANPDLDATFKQGMNQYVCATTAMYSNKYKSMYSLFFGGISYGFFSGSTFSTDSEIPFINQITTIQMDQNGNFTQYIMNNQYPVILSTTANPGNPLLFGAGAYFIRNHTITTYPNTVINLDNIRKPTVIGYIVGGIASTLANTNTQADSFGSPYVFTVTVVPKY
jgi:hypothetical protein